MSTKTYMLKVERTDPDEEEFAILTSSDGRGWFQIAITFDSFATASNVVWSMIKTMRASGMTVDDATVLEVQS